jgi:hypothetical protein
MGGKRNGPSAVLDILGPEGKRMQISETSYNKALGVAGQIRNADNISTRDREELQNTLRTNVQNNVHSGGLQSSGQWDSIENSLGGIQQELKDAVEGTKPKYRYRKYLDTMTNQVNDQPGALQTVLSRGKFGTLGA